MRVIVGLLALGALCNAKGGSGGKPSGGNGGGKPSGGSGGKPNGGGGGGIDNTNEGYGQGKDDEGWSGFVGGSKNNQNGPSGGSGGPGSNNNQNGPSGGSGGPGSNNNYNGSSGGKPGGSNNNQNGPSGGKGGKGDKDKNNQGGMPGKNDVKPSCKDMDRDACGEAQHCKPLDLTEGDVDFCCTKKHMDGCMTGKGDGGKNKGDKDKGDKNKGDKDGEEGEEDWAGAVDQFVVDELTGDGAEDEQQGEGLVPPAPEEEVAVDEAAAIEAEWQVCKGAFADNGCEFTYFVNLKRHIQKHIAGTDDDTIAACADATAGSSGMNNNNKCTHKRQKADKCKLNWGYCDRVNGCTWNSDDDECQGDAVFLD